MSPDPKQVQKNIDLCDNLLHIISALSDSDANEQNTWLKLGDIESEVKELKQLYKQIIV